jgi:hypothetical protein
MMENKEKLEDLHEEDKQRIANHRDRVTDI